MPRPDPPSRASSLRAALACAAPAVLVALAVLLPFLGSAFSVDDHTFLLEARHALADPLHPAAFDMVFEGVRIRLSHELVSGPVMAYLLVPSVLLGGSETAAHAVQLMLLAVGVGATAALALRLGLDRLRAALAALLVVASPAVLALAATAMPDVAAMAFGALGMERVAAWRDRRRPGAGIAAAAFLALAALARPHAILLLGCAAVWLAGSGDVRGRPRRGPAALLDPALLPVALAVGFVGIAVLLTHDPASGDTVVGATLRRVRLATVALNLVGFARAWAVAFPLALLWPLLRGSAFVRTPRTVVAFNLGVLGSGNYLLADPLRALPIALLTGLGLAVLADVIAAAWRSRDRTTTVLVLWLLIGAATATYVQLPPKVLVPSAPAMALLIARRWPAPSSARVRRWLGGAVVAACLAAGLTIVRADAAVAEVGRQGGRIVAAAAWDGATVWADGTAGFQWYATEAGARPLAQTAPFPQAGDVVVAGIGARLAASYPARTLVLRERFPLPGASAGSPARFFANWAGPWPWAWSHDISRVEVWRLHPPDAASR